MRRIAALLVGLVLVAGTVEAQSAVDDAAMTGIRFGINGGTGGGYVYYGGFAVCADWCGAY